MNTVFAKDYQILPGEENCSVEKIKKMFGEHHTNTCFVFEPGEYHFYQNNGQKRKIAVSNSDQAEFLRIGILLEEMESVIVDGQGAEFIFHGDMTPFAVDRCENISLRNFSVDFAVPLSAEGRILSAGQGAVLVGIDASIYPYYVENETLMFKRDAGGDAPLFAALEFNGSDNKVTEGAGDTFPKVRVFQVSEGVVRLEGDFTVLPKAGNILVLRHGKRIHPGGLVQNSESVRLENVNMYQTGGLGILFQFCKDITVSEIAFEANRKKGRRVLTGHDDGLHFSNVGGSVQVENCRFHGLMDDPINVHGTAVCVLEKVSDRTLRCAYRHPQSLGFTEWAVPGNQISFLRPGNRQEYAQLHAVEYKLITAEEFEITFDELLPDFVQPGHALENLTNTPEFICRKNYFGSTRARGLLVTTPKKVLIEENIFESSGSAILLAGDINEWYESGTCTDVTIRRNRFMSCYTSEYQFCNGVIDIEPSVEESQSACVHRNIRIMDNLFVLASPAILYADHTEDIVVEGNSIFMDEGLGEPEFILYDCKKVSVFDNTVNGVKNKMAEFKI